MQIQDLIPPGSLELWTRAILSPAHPASLEIPSCPRRSPAQDAQASALVDTFALLGR